MTLWTDRNVRAFMVIVMVAAIAGCTHRVGDLTIISTRQVNLAQAQMDPRRGSRVKGSDCRVSILWPVLPNLGKAVENALQNSGGDVLVDQVTYMSTYWIGIGSLACVRVEGTAVRVAPAAL